MEPYRERIEDFIRRWLGRYEGDRVFRVLVITVVLAALGVTLAGLQQTPTYEASARVLVGWQQGDQWWENSGGSGEQIQLLEYRDLPAPEIMRTIGTRRVAEETIQRLGLQMGAAYLLDNLTIEQVEGTSFIVLTYQDTDPGRAQRIVNTVGEVSSKRISERNSNLTATVWEKAALPESPATPHPLRNGLLTLVIGLVLCAGTVVVRPGVGARCGGTLSEWAVRPIGETGLPDGRHGGPSEAERIKEQELLKALDRRGKLTAVEAALETSLSVEEANRILEELAFAGQLEVTAEDGKLLYSFWGQHEH